MNDDCISREKAKEYILNVKNLDKYYHPRSRHEWIRYTEAIAQLDAVPSATPAETQMIDKSNFSQEQYKMDMQSAYDCGMSSTERTGHWIPVSEGLPEDEQEILFSTKTGRVYSGKYYDDNSANQWYSYRDKARAWNNVVNAWMPLPKPYEPQESEDKE